MCNLLIKNVRMRNALEPVPMWYECHEMSYGWYLCEEEAAWNVKIRNIRKAQIQPKLAQSPKRDLSIKIIYFPYKSGVWFTLDRIDKMVCECGMTPTLSSTQSETNYGKMYLRCSRHNCDLFTWWRFKPNKRSVQILTDGCE